MPPDGGQGFVVHSPFQGSGCKGMTQRMERKVTYTCILQHPVVIVFECALLKIHA